MKATGAAQRFIPVNVLSTRCDTDHHTVNTEPNILLKDIRNKSRNRCATYCSLMNVIVSMTLLLVHAITRQLSATTGSLFQGEIYNQATMRESAMSTCLIVH